MKRPDVEVRGAKRKSPCSPQRVVGRILVRHVSVEGNEDSSPKHWNASAGNAFQKRTKRSIQERKIQVFRFERERFRGGVGKRIVAPQRERPAERLHVERLQFQNRPVRTERKHSRGGNRHGIYDGVELRKSKPFRREL